jgi:twitching motility protein PilT
MESKEVLRRFKQAGWQSAPELQAFLTEASAVSRDDIERLLGLLTTKGLPGDSRDQRNRCLLFGKIAERATDKALFLPFVRALKSADGQTAATLAPLLARVNNTEGHAELCALLKSPDPALRKLVGQVLKQIGGTSVFQAVSALCGQRDFAARIEAMDVAVSIGRQHAIPALAAVLGAGSPLEKGQALQYLASAELMAKDVPGALRAIATALNDATERVALQAVAAFATLASEDDYFANIGLLVDSTNAAAAKAAIEGLRRFRSPRTMGVLERKLAGGPKAIKLSVLATLEALGSDEVVPLVVTALAMRAIDVRTRAAEVLTNLAVAGKIELARTILWLLRSRDVNVRRMAVDMAKKVGDPSGELAPRLLRYLRDEDWWVRERVMDALVEMAGRQLTRHLVGYLQDPSDVVRRYAVDALERVKDPAAVGALVRAAQSDVDWWVRERAIEAIGVLNDARAVPYLLDLLKKEPDLQRACLVALGTLKATSAAGTVAGLLDAEDPDIRLLVIETLGALEDPSQAPAVAKLQQDGDHRVRDAAGKLLTRWHVAVQAGGVVAKAYSLLERLLIALAASEGDDLILAAGQKPYMKKIGKVAPMSHHVFTPDQVRALILPHLTAAQHSALAELRDVDFSFEIKSEELRFRANVFQQLPGLSAVFRVIKDRIPVLEELGLPPVVKTFGDIKNGLVLVGGPTGSGKSTTLAGIIDHINRTSSRHVITLEDPIEVLHKQKKCLVNQREVGTHARSFETALRATLRQDPDVILVGEMRDLPTISFALTAAETGHLVLGTVHTVSVDTSVDRLINAFGSSQQPQVRSLLADTLRAVMCQYLLKRKDQAGRVIAVEVMMNNDAIANLIRKEKTFQIPSVIATSREAGMQSMDSDLERLYRAGSITAEDAYMKATNKKNFEVILGIGATGEPKPGADGAARPAAPAAKVAVGGAR